MDIVAFILFAIVSSFPQKLKKRHGVNNPIFCFFCTHDGHQFIIISVITFIERPAKVNERLLDY
nr:MAG TPA: hypothetical protein [Caudoviricetes sp.]